MGLRGPRAEQHRPFHPVVGGEGVDDRRAVLRLQAVGHAAPFRSSVRRNLRNIGWYRPLMSASASRATSSR